MTAAMATTMTEDPTEELAETRPTSVPNAVDSTVDSVAESAVVDGQTTIDGDPAPERKARRTRGRRATSARAPELSLLVTGNADGTEWQVTVSHAGEVTAADVPVAATAVSAAARELHPEVAETIDRVLESAREQQRSRVDALQAQLDAARETLAGLQD